MVLLKNEGGALPLKYGESVALFGVATVDYVKGGGGSGDVYTPYVRNIYDGMRVKEEEGKILSAEYKKNTWEQIFQKNDSNFKEAFAGYRSKKAAFVKKISDEYKIYKNSSLDRKSIEQKAETIFGDKPESLGELSLLAF